MTLHLSPAGKDEWSGHLLDAWQAAGHEQGARIADPLFEDAAARDFRLRAGSPALELGFKPFDFTKAGVYGDPAWTQRASSSLSAHSPPALPVAR